MKLMENCQKGSITNLQQSKLNSNKHPCQDQLGIDNLSRMLPQVKESKEKDKLVQKANQIISPTHDQCFNNRMVWRGKLTLRKRRKDSLSTMRILSGN
jgi:hypothetical protein